jgi:glycosyltransferase involved in cell wall biosynthesis
MFFEYCKKSISGSNKRINIPIQLGIVISRLIPFKTKSAFFFFFPFYHTGGAERVHADILDCFKSYRPLVFIQHQSSDDRFLDLFRNCGRIFNLWRFMRRYKHFIIGLIAGYINRHKKAVVFGSNSGLYYEVLPLLNNPVRCIDLLHAFGGGIETMSLHLVPRIDTRIVISANTIDDYRSLYKANNVDLSYVQRIRLIENMLKVPDTCPRKRIRENLNVIYVGRGTEEKRVHLVGRIATLCKVNKIPVNFTLVGDILNALEYEDQSNCKILGKIYDDKQLSNIYESSDLLLLTSSREGMPMVVMEAMAKGCVPVCTDVGGISLHVTSGKNGMLVSNRSETEIVHDFVKFIKLMANDRALLARISTEAYDYARVHFDHHMFCKKYTDTLLCS